MSIQKIETITATSTASSFTFTAIPDKYDHLLIYCATRRNSASGTGSGSIQFNTDTSTSNYKSSQMSGTSYFSGSPSPSGAAYSYTDRLEAFPTGNSTDTTNSFPMAVIKIWNYKDVDRYKYVWAKSSQYNSSGYSYQIYYQGVWNSTAKITELKMYPQSGASFEPGSIATLYGVMSASSSAITTIS